MSSPKGTRRRRPHRSTRSINESTGERVASVMADVLHRGAYPPHLAGQRHETPARHKPLVDALQKHGEQVFGETIPALGTPLYTDVRIFAEAGIPGVIYGAGPWAVLESHAKRADERLELEDLRRASKVIARALADLLA